MPKTSTITRLKFFESCPMCHVLFPDSLIRVPQITEAINRISEYLHYVRTSPNGHTEYLKRQYGKPVEEAIHDLTSAPTCPDCGYQSDRPTSQANDAADALSQLVKEIEAIKAR